MSSRIPQDLIDDILHRVDIVALIGEAVPLKRAGRQFKGLCPFHTEKTPSFYVDPDKQIFYCFGCSTGGSALKFLMLHERMPFPEAVRLLAEQTGVRLPENQSGPQEQGKQPLYDLMESACGFFERTLEHASQGRAAREYLEQRGVKPETGRRFRIGVAPAGWDGMLKAALKHGATTADLEACGLIVPGKSGHYDRFRERVMFPISDPRGRIIGFGGRALGDQKPKYLNSPDTVLYHKGKQLYGLNQAGPSIRKQDCAVIVEGYFDCVSLVNAGIENTVSPLGTALTVDQIRLLQRYTHHIILAFDADPAGEQATLRGIDLLIEAGMEVRVARFPDNEDPDDFVRKRGSEALKGVLEQAGGLFESLLESARRRYPAATIEERARVAQYMLPRIAKVPDAILRREYIRLLAERLGFEEDAVLQDITRYIPSEGKHREPAQRAARAQSATRMAAEDLFVALVLDNPALLERREVTETSGLLQDGELQSLLRWFGEQRPAGTTSWLSQLEVDGQADAATRLIALAGTIEDKAAALEDCMQRLRRRAHERHLADLRGQLHEAQTQGRKEALERLLAEYQRAVKGGPT